MATFCTDVPDDKVTDFVSAMAHSLYEVNQGNSPLGQAITAAMQTPSTATPAQSSLIADAWIKRAENRLLVDFRAARAANVERNNPANRW